MGLKINKSCLFSKNGFLVICLILGWLGDSSIAAQNPSQQSSLPSTSSPVQMPSQNPGKTIQGPSQNQGNQSQALSSSANQARPTTPQAALERLWQGNKRFMQDGTTCPENHQMRRLATVSKQKPFAIVLGCSDSRVPPEIAFDQGIGDIFVVRIAGNVVSKLEMESIEYSALYNDSSIIVVLGHQNCGAVTAVLENKTQDIESIAELIKPAVYQAKYKKENADLTLKDAIIINVQNSVDRVKRNALISKLIKEGKIMVVGAYYDLATGEAQRISP